MNKYSHPRRKRPRPYRLVLGNRWERYLNGGNYGFYDQNDAKQELTNAITEEINKQIIDDVLAQAAMEKGYVYAPQAKPDYILDESLQSPPDPTYIVSPVRITPSVEITPDEMKSDLWQAIANPILTKLRSLLPPQSEAQKLWDIKPQTSFLPDISTLRISPSTLRRLSMSKTSLKIGPPATTTQGNISSPSGTAFPEINWYSIEDYPDPLTAFTILTSNP